MRADDAAHGGHAVAEVGAVVDGRVVADRVEDVAAVGALVGFDFPG